MMTVKRTPAPAGLAPLDCVGMFQTVLVWGKGVSTGAVVAAQLVEGGAYVDLVIEYEAPVRVVPDDFCGRVQSCRFDSACPFVTSCERHVHGSDCGGCV